MRPDTERPSRGAPNPVPGADAMSLALGTALLLAAPVGLLVAVTYPTAGAVVGAAALVARYGAKPIACRLRRAAREREVTPVCVPRTNLCLEA
ncbi:hypothetical protein [Halorubrum halophilum]|uniref:hypothetical protein n=1 Tax=Halorubrum halophilum TaxID=413816 RepID=UPI0006787698|nr:hypothetical protein [Halorubrum halophilum]